MKGKKIVSLILTGVTAASLLTAPAQAANTAPKQAAAYTISTEHWSREDFSKQANPKVFTGPYTRELYNAIRQTMVDGTSEKPGYTMVSKEDYSEVKNLIDRMDGVVWYKHHVPQNFQNYWQYLDYFAVSAEMPEHYQEPLEFIQPVIEKVEQMDTDSEKVTYLNDYLRTLLTYEEREYAGVQRIFAPHAEELESNCGAYAGALKFLCGAAGIPCFSISTKTHTWNLVYADGQWLHVDVSANDLAGHNNVLLAKTYHSEKKDVTPEATAFTKELLVPGSTK